MTQNERDYLDDLVKDAIKIIENNENLFSFYRYLKKGVKNSTFNTNKNTSQEEAQDFILYTNLSNNMGLGFIITKYYEYLKKVDNVFPMMLHDGVVNKVQDIKKITILHNALFYYLTDKDHYKILEEAIKKYYE